MIALSQEQPDLLLVMGTALAVRPFSLIPSFCKEKTPKVLFNMTNTKDTSQYDFCDGKDNKIFVEGKCDETLAKLAKDCGWLEDFRETLPAVHKGKF